MKKILYLVTEDNYFYSHRLELATFIKQQGYEVGVATKCSKYNPQYKQAINNNNLQLFELKFFCRTSCINPFKEFLALKELYDIYKTFKPDIVHHVALKPIIYGTIIAQIVKVKCIINALAGLGFVFTEAKYSAWFKNIKLQLKQNFLQIILTKILKIIFNNNKNNKILLLQNKDDLDKLNQFIDINKLKLTSTIIPGSGIITDRYFAISPLSFTNYNIKIILAARLLWTKGIAEFVDAAKQIKTFIKKNNLAINPEFILYGNIDLKNPASINDTNINEWQNQGLIVWKKFDNNIIEAYNNSHIVVLPSYREGLPKSLLEAALCARAIVTTDVPGCREIVEHGVNGYLVPKQDSVALAKALLILMQDRNLMVKMGMLGREKVYNKFSAQVVFPQMLALYTEHS